MAFLNDVNRYFAYRFKEIELRVHTWKRSREISRAYDTRRRTGTAAAAFRPPRRVGRIAVVAAAVLLAVCVVIGAIHVMPPLASFVDGKTAVAAEHQTAYAVELPETAQLPEGYAEMAIPEVDANAAAMTFQRPPSPPPTGDALVNIFKNGMPRGLSSTGYLIFADKAADMMYIFRDTQRGWEIERAYQMATGERRGRKLVEGDKKTPEGVYHIVGRKFRYELTSLYGPAAFILDYPNEEDRRERRTGHGIWIHGSERGNIPPLFTQGCLAVSNPDIIDFASILGYGIGVPVIIVSGEEGKAHLASVDFPQLKARGAEVIAHHNSHEADFRKRVLEWKTAWESKDIEKYSTFYSTSTFRDGARNWSAFRTHKMQTFAAYATISVDVDKIALTELTPNMATVKFLQVYATNLNRFDNAKRLIFRRENDSWKIHREIPFPKEEFFL